MRCGLITLTVFEFLGLLGGLGMAATAVMLLGGDNPLIAGVALNFIMALVQIVLGIVIIVKFLKYLCNT